MVILLCPTLPEDHSGYAIGCGFQWLVAFWLAYYGWRTGVRRYVSEAVGLLWLAPIFFWVIVGVTDILVHPAHR